MTESSEAESESESERERERVRVGWAADGRMALFGPCRDAADSNLRSMEPRNSRRSDIRETQDFVTQGRYNLDRRHRHITSSRTQASNKVAMCLCCANRQGPGPSRSGGQVVHCSAARSPGDFPAAEQFTACMLHLCVHMTIAFCSGG